MRTRPLSLLGALTRTDVTKGNVGPLPARRDERADPRTDDASGRAIEGAEHQALVDRTAGAEGLAEGEGPKDPNPEADSEALERALPPAGSHADLEPRDVLARHDAGTSPSDERDGQGLLVGCGQRSDDGSRFPAERIDPDPAAGHGKGGVLCESGTRRGCQEDPGRSPPGWPGPGGARR